MRIYLSILQRCGIKKILLKLKVAHPVINLIGCLTVISDLFRIAHQYFILPVSNSSGIVIILVCATAFLFSVFINGFTAVQQGLKGIITSIRQTFRIEEMPNTTYHTSLSSNYRWLSKYNTLEDVYTIY